MMPAGQIDMFAAALIELPPHDPTRTERAPLAPVPTVPESQREPAAEYRPFCPPAHDVAGSHILKKDGRVVKMYWDPARSLWAWSNCGFFYMFHPRELGDNDWTYVRPATSNDLDEVDEATLVPR